MPKIDLIDPYRVSGPYPAHSFLVDGVWPRGLTKEKLTGVEWLKTVAPSRELRQWFHQNRDQWETFKKRYEKELESSPDWQPLLQRLRAGESLALLTGNKDQTHNQAVVLRDFLLMKLAR